jgi:hypothetical protein
MIALSLGMRRQNTGPISRHNKRQPRGNRYLRVLFVQAAWPALPILSLSPRAREGGPSASGFDFGGAGAELWGLFGASRSKPLAERGTEIGGGAPARPRARGNCDRKVNADPRRLRDAVLQEASSAKAAPKGASRGFRYCLT